MAAKKYASDEQAAETLADALMTLPDNYLMCRDVKHAWDVTDELHVTKNVGSKIKEVARLLTCLRCGMTRKDVFLPTAHGLEKVGMSYPDKPEGYGITGVPRGNKPSLLVQAEQYRRVVERHVASSKPPIKKKRVSKKVVPIRKSA